ncbi:hypothetical protein L1887_34933 [Cichorium endivia]|nr:hypothetical protein L1887_34933 [Cichorium endivia]
MSPAEAIIEELEGSGVRCHWRKPLLEIFVVYGRSIWSRPTIQSCLRVVFFSESSSSPSDVFSASFLLGTTSDVFVDNVREIESNLKLKLSPFDLKKSNHEQVEQNAEIKLSLCILRFTSDSTYITKNCSM